MTGDTALQLLHEEAARERRRLRHGLTAIGASLLVFLLSAVLWGEAIMVVMLLAGAVSALLVGIAWVVEGGVKSLLTARDIRRLKELPQARVIDR